MLSLGHIWLLLIKTLGNFSIWTVNHNVSASFINFLFVYFSNNLLLLLLCYSEPKSILAPEPMLSPEQLQEIIRQHGADSRPASSMQLYGDSMQQNGGSRPTSSMQSKYIQEVI